MCVVWDMIIICEHVRCALASEPAISSFYLSVSKGTGRVDRIGQPGPRLGPCRMGTRSRRALSLSPRSCICIVVPDRCHRIAVMAKDSQWSLHVSGRRLGGCGCGTHCCTTLENKFENGYDRQCIRIGGTTIRIRIIVYEISLIQSVTR